MYHGNLLASLSPLLLGKNVPVVWNVRHSLYELDSEKRTTKWVIKACKVLSKRTKAVIYNSNLSRKQHQAFGFSSLNGLVIPNGFELSRLLFSEESRAVIRSELGIDESTNVVGHVARFHPMKDHVGFIKAAIKVLKRDENTVFVMLGTDVTDDNSALINEISGDFRDKFRLLGEQSNVEQFMSAFDLFVLSSWSEAFPNVLGEAMACGLPCVTTDVGDAAYIVDETGLVVPPRNPDLLASAIINMLEKIERDFAVLKNKARERVEQNFSLDSTVDQYRSIYDETLPN
jgi:glycosyltransferase involved in cell wall biosynthesis